MMNENTRNTMMSSDKQDWSTPPWLTSLCENIFKLNADAAADQYNSGIFDYFLSELDDSLNDVASWQDKIISKYNLNVDDRMKFWLNPPYGRGIINWVDKAIHEICTTNIDVLMLLPARTDTKWFDKLVKHSSIIYFLRGRLKFLDKDKELDAAPFPSALFYLTRFEVEAYDSELRKLCTLVVDK